MSLEDLQGQRASETHNESHLHRMPCREAKLSSPSTRTGVRLPTRCQGTCRPTPDTRDRGTAALAAQLPPRWLSGQVQPQPDRVKGPVILPRAASQQIRQLGRFCVGGGGRGGPQDPGTSGSCPTFALPDEPSTGSTAAGTSQGAGLGGAAALSLSTKIYQAANQVQKANQKRTRGHALLNRVP